MISGWWRRSITPEDQLKPFIIRIDCLPANISGVHKIQFLKKCTISFYLVYWVTLRRVCEGHCYLNWSNRTQQHLVEAAWQSGERVGLTIQWSRVRVPL